ncbi:MAG: fused MFS/spermidine synthase [Candidatus Methanoperedens sp.]|nr:fused MFS/spermidine synthase [Candidatus Methanoperedens sp.]
MAALIYQISWTKNLSYVFGTSVYAIGTVLACFMAGLAVGSFVLGRRADRSPNPVRLFAFVEIALGAYALLLIPLFTILPQPYSYFHRIFEGTPIMNFMLFALSFQVLIIPTSLIGGTFPIMNRIYSRMGTIGKDVGTVYSVDTVFAGAGALIAGFVLLPKLGISMTIAVGAAINILAGIYLYYISLPLNTEYPARNMKKSDIKKQVNGLDKTDKAVFLGYFLSGFAALAAEVIWIRALSPTGIFPQKPRPP